MAVTCQQEKVSRHLYFKGLAVLYVSQVTNRDRILWRRLITLIFAGWIPHDMASSRSCLSLKAEIRLTPYSNRNVEGSPERDRVSVSDLGSCEVSESYMPPWNEWY
jgi:hypothetical protein